VKIQYLVDEVVGLVSRAVGLFVTELTGKGYQQGEACKLLASIRL
jgi:hypothetical protein